MTGRLILAKNRVLVKPNETIAPGRRRSWRRVAQVGRKIAGAIWSLRREDLRRQSSSAGVMPGVTATSWKG